MPPWFLRRNHRFLPSVSPSITTRYLSRQNVARVSSGSPKEVVFLSSCCCCFIGRSLAGDQGLIAAPIARAEWKFGTTAAAGIVKQQSVDYVSVRVVERADQRENIFFCDCSRRSIHPRGARCIWSRWTTWPRRKRRSRHSHPTSTELSLDRLSTTKSIFQVQLYDGNWKYKWDLKQFQGN